MLNCVTVPTNANNVLLALTLQVASAGIAKTSAYTQNVVNPAQATSVTAKLPDLIDFGVARVLPHQQEVCLPADTASDTPAMPLDVVLSLSTVQ